MSGRRPRRAAIVGFVGFGNLGDEMILAGVERLLAPVAIEVASLFGGPGLILTTAFPRARRRSTWRSLPTLAAIRELRRLDLLLIGGGGLINDHWPLLIPRYVSWILAARMVGARVVWLGVGVGPIRRRAWRWMASLGARLSDTVLVRDRPSADLLGGTSSRIRVIPDPAMFLEVPDRGDPDPILGLILREPVHDSEPERTRLMEVLAALADAGRSSGLQPRLLMMDPAADRAFAERVADRLARHAERPTVETLGPSAAQVWEQLGVLQVAVSVRLHGLLLSAMVGVPCVPVAYDGKVTAAAERLGLGDVVIDPDGPPDENIVRSLAAVQLPATRDVVARRVSALRGQADDVREMLR